MAAPTTYLVVIAMVPGVHWYPCRPLATTGGGDIDMNNTSRYRFSLEPILVDLIHFLQEFGHLSSYGVMEDIKNINLKFNQGLVMIGGFQVLSVPCIGTNDQYRCLKADSSASEDFINHLKGI